jgi:ABC-type oligopeptide transport system substrate-binding subunit
MVLDSDGKYKNDVVPVEETDANTLTITLTQASHIRVSVMSMTNI